jgi:crossover junction endodeoxyribonuclease RuvC
VGLPHGADKTASRRLACQKWPAFSHLWARVKDDGRAEAALLAYFGSKEQ